MENINIVALSGNVSDFTSTINGSAKTGSFYIEWSLPISIDSGQSSDRVFCMVRGGAVDVIQNAVDTGRQVLIQGRVRTRLLRYEAKGKKPVHAAYIAVKSAVCLPDGPLVLPSEA